MGSSDTRHWHLVSRRSTLITDIHREGGIPSLSIYITGNGVLALKQLTRYRVFHKYRLLAGLLFLAGLFIAWFFLSGLYDFTIGFDKTSPEYLYYGPQMQRDLIASTVEDYDLFVTSSYEFTIIMTPVFAAALSLLFIREKSGLFPYSFTRRKKRLPVLAGSLFSHALLTAAVLFLAYVLFCCVGLLFRNPATDGAYGQRTVFNLLFGSNFYARHIFLYFLLEGFVKFFILPFVYSLFACCVAFWTDKTYYCLVVPVVYYFFCSIVFGAGLGFQPLAPTFTMGFSSYGITQPFTALLPLVIPVVFCVVSLARACRREEST